MKMKIYESRVGSRGRAPASGAVRCASHRTLRSAGGLVDSIARIVKVNDEGVIDCTRGGCAPRAFTIVEMLVVLAILGVLAALVVPALKNFGHADAVAAATSQMQDDVGRARQLAISHHTTVYMVFVPENFWIGLSAAEQALPVTTNLCDKQLTGYTFVSLRTVGDQPGQRKPHYLAPWQTLPEGTFIAQQKFIPPDQVFYISKWDNDYNHAAPVPIYGFDTNNFAANSMGIPFPTEDAPSVLLPYIAFNYLGQLTTNGVDAAASHEYIPLARGNVAPAWDPVTKVYQLSQPDISEVPPGNSTNTYNIIDIEPLTGRTTLQQPKVQ